MKTIACIGCGTVGSAWAVVFARAGHNVILYDRNYDALEMFSLPLIEDTLALLIKTGLEATPLESIMARIQTSSSLEDAVIDADYIQESIVEDLTVKLTLFKNLSEITKPETILASSTSALKGSDFLLNIKHPERTLIAHPVNPPSLIPLVELCGTGITSPEVITHTSTFLTEAGMKPVILNKEIDGFILNRLQYTLVAEALHLVGEGYCSASDIDRVMTEGLALRWASMGPFEVAHLNASKGFQGFVDQLGPMMRTMGKEARTDYDWSEALAHEIHETLTEKTPIKDILAHQRWRNAQILSTRKMQDLGKKSKPLKSSN